MRARAAVRRDFRLSRSSLMPAQLRLQQRVGAFEFFVPQQQAVDALGKVLQRGHGAWAWQG